MNKKKHSRQGKPNGMNYSQVLAKRALVRQAVEKAAADTTVQLRSDINTQKAMWLMVVSMADAFGIGPERMNRDFFPAMQKNVEKMKKMEDEVDAEYAEEKLRQRAEKVAGMKIEYLYEHEFREARKSREARDRLLDAIGGAV